MAYQKRDMLSVGLIKTMARSVATASSAAPFDKSPNAASSASSLAAWSNEARWKWLGEEGAGLDLALATLQRFRTSVAAAACGFARRALDEAVSYSANRQMFGGHLADLQMTQATLGEMALEIDASALLIYRAAWKKDTGAERSTREAAMAKLYATEAAQKIIDNLLAQAAAADSKALGFIRETVDRIV